MSTTTTNIFNSTKNADGDSYNLGKIRSWKNDEKIEKVRAALETAGLDDKEYKLIADYLRLVQAKPSLVDVLLDGAPHGYALQKALVSEAQTRKLRAEADKAQEAAEKAQGELTAIQEALKAQGIDLKALLKAQGKPAQGK